MGLLLVVGSLVHGIPFAFWKGGSTPPPASFPILGVTGGSDVIMDAYLSNGTNPTVHFSALTGATSYDVVIKDATDTTTQCQVLGATVSPVSPSSCGLVASNTYKIHITANVSGTLASNDGFSFYVGVPTMNLEVPIDLITSNVQPSGLTTYESSRVSLNTSDYDGTTTYSFEITANGGGSQPAYLINGAGTTVATLTITNAAGYTRYATTFTPTAGADTYRLKANGSGSNWITTARILIKQVGATKTKIYIPLTNISSNGDNIASTTSTQGASRYSLWKKDTSAWATIAAGSPWTFEAVIASSASSKTAYADFVNKSTSTTLATVSTVATVPTLLTSSFADNLSGFNNLDTYQLQGRISATSGGNYAIMYKAGLWVSLTSLSKAEVYYNFEYAGLSYLETSVFSNPMIYNESTAAINSGATGCETLVKDNGTSDTIGTGTTVSGSSLSFSSTTKTLARTASNFTVTSGNRFFGTSGCTSGSMTTPSQFTVVKSSTSTNSGPGSFSISGITGGTDSTQDAWLTNGTTASVNFTSSAGASTYDIVIKDSAGVVTLCSSLNQASSPVAPSGCGLTNGGTYKVYVTAKNASGSTTAAFNDGLSFTVDNTAPTANTITGITGVSDLVVDTWLTGGLTASVNWNAFTNAASYDVTIKDSTGTTTVCATQNTTATAFNFTTCTLTNTVAYKAYVTAKSAGGFQTTNASNTGMNFTVDNTTPGSFSITGITGGTDVLADAYLSNGTDPTVVYGTSANVYRYDIVIKDSTDTTTVCSLLNQTGSPSAVTCGLTNGLIYNAHVTAKSISGYMTQAASNDGFAFTVGALPPTPAANFLITGATGGSDSTTDNWLTSGTTVTANWYAASGATSYDVTIRNSTDTADACATQNTTSTSYTFTGCTLSDATTYLIKVVAKNPPAASTTALNNSYAFTVITAAPGSFSVTGATGGTDATADDLLMNGTTVTANWNASSGATSYDVTIRNSGDTADVCATQNTASTSYTFTGCTLTANTTYTIKVVAKNGTQSTPAYNSPFSFLVPNTLTFCPTGSSTAKALIIYDSGGAGGNYSGGQNCNFTISPPATASSIVLNFTSFASNDNSDILTIYDGTNTSGTLLGTYKSTSVTPPNLTASSGNMYLTWVSGASNHAAGYDMNYKASYAAAGSFSITGIQGGSDTTNDTVLTDNSSGVTVVWGASTGAASYDVIIRNATNTNDVCAKQNTASTSYNFASCNLMLGATYVATVYAKNNSGAPVAASNNPFSFTYEARPTSFTITGATGGTDVTADSYLEDGTTVTINWNASSGQTSYDVAIITNDGHTKMCPTVNVGSGLTSYTFTGCTLVTGQFYKIEVIANNAAGSTMASNSTFNFKVGGAWTPTSLTSAPSTRKYHTAVWTGSEMIIWGSDVGLNTGGKYNPTTDSWTATSTGANVPAGRYYHTAIWTGTEMIVWGGTKNTYLNTGGRYNPSSNSWVASSLSLVIERSDHTSTWTGSEMIIWGGYDGTTYVNTGGKYNPSTDSWTATSTGANVPSQRRYHTAVWTGTEMIVWGGTNGSYFNTGGKYNPATNSWTATSTGANVPAIRQDHTAIWTGTEMIVWGGANGASLNTGGKYNPTTDSWTATSTGANVPSARYYHTAVWTGSEMIIWGGGSSLNTGGKYDPATDSWTTTSTGTNVPTGRYRHSAVWTGSVMIVWGGYGGGYLNTGGKYDPATDSWTTTSTGTNVPSGRYRHSAVWTGSEMIVWGGTNGTVFNTGGKYDPATDSWTTTSTGTNVPSARQYHTAIWTSSEMIIWGGVEGSNTPVNSGGKYNPTTDAWTATGAGANVPSARQYHTAVWTGTEMIVWGGYNGSYLNTGGKYNPTTDSWTSDFPPFVGMRNSHTAVWTGTEMIIWGGNTGSALNTGGKYNPTTDSWTTTSIGANLPAARYDHTAVWTGTEMIIWGGYNGSYPNTGGKYNPATDSWTATSTGANVPSGRRYHSAILAGSEMIIWGGHDGTSYVNTGGKYNLSTDSWTTTSTGANVPSARGLHSTVWTGSVMIVWGGYNGSVDLNTGGKYNPTTDSWTTTSTGANVPSSRRYATAIWTDTVMIVWGGSSGGATNTGGKYNPSTDSWTATSTGANVPTGRYYHTAVWTGSEMIVWGGSSGPVHNTGGKYNPSTDSWTATSTGANVPTIRYNHTAVWTGSEMIVWGGYTGSSYLNTGGKYNPSSDSWSSMNGVSVPSARQEHKAVWTGTEMIIWGGWSGSLLNSGGKYNPSSNSWDPTSTGANVPTGRRYHTAIWTGTEMIIWGGHSGVYLNTGGKYTPSTDTWSTTSTGANVPTARRYHTAIWTGTEMIVWGGNSGSYLNTGGKYNPATDSWTATSTGTNVPTARQDHSAIWTGFEMIVWGGYNGSNTNSGGNYAP